MKIPFKNLLLFFHLILVVSTFPFRGFASVVRSEHRDHLIKVNSVIHHNFMNTLNEAEKRHVENAYVLLNSTQNESVRLTQFAMTSIISEKLNPEKIILFVPGMPDHHLSGYSQTLYQLSLIGSPVYIHNWNEKRRLGYNARHLQKSILKLAHDFPKAQITIIGYCAGGVITAYALKHFRDNNPELYSRLYAHTVATPFAGYGAPHFARVVSPIIGRSIIQVGIGVQFGDLNQQKLRCTQWATVNCDLDWHACPTKKTVPQLSARDGSPVQDVCEGGRNELNNRTHATATAHVIRETIEHTKAEVSQNTNELLP